MNAVLTPLELKVMKELWSLKKGFVKDIVERWKGESTPAYNTISTTVRILEDKGFVDHEAFGRSHRYFPLLTKSAYQHQLLKNVISEAFSGSINTMVSTLVDNEKLDKEEIEKLKELINKSK